MQMTILENDYTMQIIPNMFENTTLLAQIKKWRLQIKYDSIDVII